MIRWLAVYLVAMGCAFLAGALPIPAWAQLAGVITSAALLTLAAYRASNTP